MSANLIPDKLIAYNAYLGGDVLLGLADVELPSVEHMTSTLSGAGIAGEVETPAFGLTKSMSLKLKWHNKTRQNIALLKPENHEITLRASVQHTGADGLETRPEKVVVRGVCKSASLGKYEKAAAQDTDTDIELTYIKIVLGGEDVLEIDKLNYVYAVNGTDHLAGVRRDIGLEG